MSNLQKLISAIIILLGTMFGAWVAMTDDDPTTKPDVDAVVEDAADVIGAARDMAAKDSPEDDNAE